MSEFYPTLYLQSYDHSKLIDAQNQFYYCYRNSLDNYKTAENLKRFLEKEDLNLVCRDELENFRTHVSKIGIKETRAIYHTIHHARQYLI